MFDVQVTLDGKPLRYTFVSYQPDFHDATVALTDGNGTARFPDVKPSATIDLVVHAQNLAVRMLDGTSTSTVEKSLRFRNKKSGSRLNVSPRDKSFPYYDIMARCYESYETVFGAIAPFNGPSRRQYPFGGRKLEPHELKRSPAVDCRYPEKIAPGDLPWVQPQSVTGGRPLMPVKSQTTDKRLFGTPKRPATTIPHEYAHAIHFALLSNTERWILAAKYGIWIAGELAKGKSGTHRTDKRTAPLIAYVESIGIFSQRLHVFATQVEPTLKGAALHKAFVADELSEKPKLGRKLPGYVKIATMNDDGSIRPHLTGNSTEGAVYGALFLALANRTSLSSVVNLYLRCGSFDVGGFLSYARNQRRGALREDLAAVSTTWKLS